MTDLWHTYRWKQTAERVKRRDGHLCTYCGTAGSPRNRLTVHHAAGYTDPFNESGLRTACQSCHGRISQRAGAAARRSIVRSHAADAATTATSRKASNRFLNTLGKRR